MSGTRLKSTSELVDGLYEDVLTAALRARLDGLGDRRTAVIEKLPAELVAEHLARTIHEAARLALHSLHGDKAPERQLSLANTCIEGYRARLEPWP